MPSSTRGAVFQNGFGRVSDSDAAAVLDRCHATWMSGRQARVAMAPSCHANRDRILRGQYITDEPSGSRAEDRGQTHPLTQ